MAILTRKDGSVATWTSAELELMLAHLAAAESAGCENNEDIFFMASSPFLLIIDLRWTVKRRLAESFQLQEDRALPFNIRLVSSQRCYNLSEALFASGYSGPVVTDLSVVYMALYESNTQTGTYAQNVGVGASLVKNEGFGENPAEIKSLVANNGIQLTETDSEIVIKALFDPTVTDSRY